jgi:hypothetical protein
VSRSYRKPWVKDGYKRPGKKIPKRTANRKVRKTKDIANGKSYRKVVDPWTICDYRWYEPKSEKLKRK